MSQASANPLRLELGLRGEGMLTQGLSGCHSQFQLLCYREAGRALGREPRGPPRLEHCGPGVVLGELWQMGFEEGLLEPAGCSLTRSGCSGLHRQDRHPCSPAYGFILATDCTNPELILNLPGFK